MTMMIKSTIRHINVLNLLLLGALYISANSYLLPAHREKTAPLQIAAKMGPPWQTVSAAARFQPPPAAEHIVISERNLFHPERKIPVETKEAQPAAKPEFVLYGTLITDTEAIAYMEDRKAAYGTPGRGKRQQKVMLGKALSNYTLSEIYHDSVLMVKGDDRIEVRISDTRKARSRTAQVTVAPPAPKETKDILSIMEKKPAGSGLPPGVILKEMPPEMRKNVPPQFKDMLNDLIKQRMVPKQ
jgi:hypothetical protein